MSDPEQKESNLHYFESASMHNLYELIEAWQKANSERFLSISIHQDNGLFCCIAVTNPMEVIITDGTHHANTVKVSQFGTLMVSNM